MGYYNFQWSLIVFGCHFLNAPVGYTEPAEILPIGKGREEKTSHKNYFFCNIVVKVSMFKVVSGGKGMFFRISKWRSSVTI
jgi:hypothetical protein